VAAGGLRGARGAESGRGERRISTFLILPGLETLACLEVAAVSSHITQDSAAHDQLDRVVGTLVKLVAK
jgi:hypothetical protein